MFMSRKCSRYSTWFDGVFSAIISPVVGLIGFVVLFLLCSTIRFRLVGFEDSFERSRKGESVIVAMWHSQILLMPFL